MKKILILLLALSMVFSMTACGSSGEDTQKEAAAITAIEVGGDFDPIDLSGKALGEYTKIDIPEWFTTSEDATSEMYYCEGSDTPYIAIVSRPFKADSFEATIADYAETWGDGYYQMLNEKIAYLISSQELDDGTIFYKAVLVYDLGDTTKSVIFYGNTEEVQIADSDLYFNILTGYESKLNESSEDFNASVYAEYDDSYGFPNVYACEDTDTYDKEKLFFDYLDELGFSEEEYNKWAQNWNDETTRAYLNALGFEVVYSTTKITDDYNAYAYCCELNKGEAPSYNTFIWINRGEKNYLINTWTFLMNPEPAYLTAMLDSIKVK